MAGINTEKGTMKAWQFVGTGKPLVLNEVPIPRAVPGEVVLAIKSAGLCHSDVGAMTDPGWMALIQKLPITFGHEVAGVITEVGEGVTEYQVGDRVGINPGTATQPSYARDGGFSYYATSRWQDLVRIPEGVSFDQAAAGTDAGATSYHAVKTIGRVKAGEKVGIIGFGGLGQLGARAAVLLGAEVYVAEIKEAVWPHAIAAGCKKCVKSITELADVAFDCIIDYAGFGKTTADAIEVVGNNGRVVVVGMGKLESTINTKAIILKQVQVLGSMGATNQDLAEVYDLFATGKLNPVLETIGFDDIPAGEERLHAGTVTGRLVAHIAD